MYRIEYDIETGLVHNLAIVEDENYPETLVDGVAYYDGDIPENVEGYEKVLYYKLVNTQKNPEGISTFAVWEGNLYAEYKPIEGWIELADAKDVADLFIQSQKPKGLMFKPKDMSVYAKSLSKLNLGSEDFTVVFIGRTEGSDTTSYTVFGNVNSQYTNSSMKIYDSVSQDTTNGIAYILMEKPLSGASTDDSLRIGKADKTKNLHHIVITRKGNIVTAYINGRRIHSKTQSRILDFSNFVYDVYCSNHFYGGSVYNYAMTEAEALALWNGGRYDEYVVPLYRKSNNDSIKEISAYYGVKTDISTNHYRFKPNVSAGYWGLVFKYPTIKNHRLKITATIKSNKSSFKIRDLSSQNLSTETSISLNADVETKIVAYVDRISDITSGGFYIHSQDVATDSDYIEVKDLKVEYCSCLLEYKPENIRVDRMINTGTAGSDYDLIYSLPTKPTIIYEAPYKDKIVLEDKTTPDFHPIAVGQRCYTSDGKILEAKLPAKGSEWAVSDWKQTSA